MRAFRVAQPRQPRAVAPSPTPPARPDPNCVANTIRPPAPKPPGDPTPIVPSILVCPTLSPRPRLPTAARTATTAPTAGRAHTPAHLRHHPLRQPAPATWRSPAPNTAPTPSRLARLYFCVAATLGSYPAAAAVRVMVSANQWAAGCGRSRATQSVHGVVAEKNTSGVWYGQRVAASVEQCGAGPSVGAALEGVARRSGWFAVSDAAQCERWETARCPNEYWRGGREAVRGGGGAHCGTVGRAADAAGRVGGGFANAPAVLRAERCACWTHGASTECAYALRDCAAGRGARRAQSGGGVSIVRGVRGAGGAFCARADRGVG
eukprot:ctg_342.g238